MNPDQQDELRLRVSEAMDLNAFSQNEVSRQSGVSQGLISRFLRGAGISEENGDKLTTWVDNDDQEPTLPDSHEVRQAIRCYRYLRKLEEQGARFIVREKDGTERALLFLW
jgi:predicted XRE-type DNA-binding protein